MMPLLLAGAMIAFSIPQERNRSALNTVLSDSRGRNVGSVSCKTLRSNI